VCWRRPASLAGGRAHSAPAVWVAACVPVARPSWSARGAALACCEAGRRTVERLRQSVASQTPSSRRLSSVLGAGGACASQAVFSAPGCPVRVSESVPRAWAAGAGGSQQCHSPCGTNGTARATHRARGGVSGAGSVQGGLEAQSSGLWPGARAYMRREAAGQTCSGPSMGAGEAPRDLRMHAANRQ
jgi:hypothetical protein